ncbi:E3 SUMO-protein ligase SIZ1-like [Chenopodium quinoa]|uniref:E3 SUMO-protein ligase SIZ1-like n=1 Tax=Chenopodium quinoa TaxID=63459 RepID=UPI000B78513E|nr:E3 SUMO-protein ligase SIZ1-like [Chenopodium quinoa]XP_021734205.1 E3 SUMO-protein ligase SIZ1-like [Chenopodium quinoa]
MDLVASCKDKLQYFRIKELKDVLTQLGFSKQGKKQELVDRILAFLVDDQASKMWVKRPALSKEELARLVDDIYRKMQGSGATDLASKAQSTSDTATPTITLKPKEEVDDSLHVDMKIRCPCGSSLLTESMIKCEDPRCQVWQHISCVIIPEKPMDGIPPVPSQFYCEVCRLNRADPFWSTLGHPLSSVKLMASTLPTDSANPVQCAEKTFHLTRSDKELLAKPDYAVQAWCMLLNDKVSFRMQWPQYADLQVNGMPVRAISRPGSQLLGANGRDDGPNISQCTRDGINKIFISGCDSRIFCFGVRLVKRRSLHQILSLIPKESDGELLEDALARVRRCIGGGETENADSDSDLEVVAESITVNLRCPMSGSRMKIAGRFRLCLHMGCFDLETFVEMQQRSRKWQCPICLKNYSLESIIIDPYFNRIANMMQSCGEDTTEIEVKPDGSWRVKSDTERRDLRHWHLPDGSLCLPDEVESKQKPEASKPIKQEGTGLKLGIRKNSNGVWEVSKHGDTNTLSSGDRVLENLSNGGPKIIPMSSSATVSGRDGEDTSVNQDANGAFDFSINNGLELDSISLNLDPTYGLATQNAAAAAKDSEVIVLSDSDEENGMMVHGVIHNNGLMDNGVNYAVDPHTGSYQEDPGLGVGGSSCLDLFNPADDEFGLPLWPLPTTTQGASSFHLFGSDGDGPDTLSNPHLTSVNCSTPMNGYMLPPETAINHMSFMPDSSVGQTYNDLNDGLVDNPLAFGGEDPALQIFLPTRPSDACGPTDARNQQDMSNGLRGEDWISLRLGDGGDRSHDESGAMNGLHTGPQPHSREGATDSLAETASFLLGSSGSKSDKTRERPDSPFLFQRSDSPSPFPQHKRSVRQRLYLSIDSDSE